MHNHLRFLFYNSGTFACINQNNVDESGACLINTWMKISEGRCNSWRDVSCSSLEGPSLLFIGIFLKCGVFLIYTTNLPCSLVKFKNDQAKLQSSSEFSGFDFLILFVNSVSFPSMGRHSWQHVVSFRSGAAVLAGCCCVPSYRGLNCRSKGTLLIGKENVSK